MDLHLWGKCADGTDVPVTVHTSVEFVNPDGTLFTPPTHEEQIAARQGFAHERDVAYAVADEDRPLYHPLRYRN